MRAAALAALAPFTLPALEVGTYRGGFAAAFLQFWNGSRLWCVDPYRTGYDPSDPANDVGLMHLLEAAHNFGPNAARVAFIVAASLDAAATFADGSLGLVYLDGCHQREAVAADARAWWPKIARGGVLAGHDYCCPGEPNFPWAATVKPAVDEFADRERVTVKPIREADGSPWSWYVRKLL